MTGFIEPLAKLINEFSKLPGIGRRTAARLAYYVIESEEDEAIALSDAIVQARQSIVLCLDCGDYSDQFKCSICRDSKRKSDILCVVGDPRDVAAMENTGEYSGKYHVLHGTISPSENRGPDDIRIKELLTRLEGVKEVILATNPDVEGEVTAMYISQLIKPLGIKATRIAHGVPVGSDLKYADEVTLGRAIAGRIEI
ncbi:MAG: recombination protein RecR [Clostridiales bacterium]|nr:recombination protein RecR [Clostridiales bacterium]